MMAIMQLVLFTLFTFSCAQLEEGDECFLNTSNIKGKCTVINQCSYARNLLKSRQTPEHCGFYGKIPIVCCLNDDANDPKPGQISQQKCRPNLPTERSPSTNHTKDRVRPVVAFATGAGQDEFRHMAGLGYGQSNNIQWLCVGGGIRKFPFTILNLNVFSGEVKYIRLGNVNIANTINVNNKHNYLISQFFKHPKFKPPSTYHDIALLRLDRNVDFDRSVQPACLYVNQIIPNKTFIVVGWGLTEIIGERSSYLLKADVNFIDYDECGSRYVNTLTWRLPNGISEDFQICAGSSEGKDTCEGDSGGPLQIYAYDDSTNIKYSQIVGVTSFGKTCGFKDSVGVYVKVSSYLSWIESIVWGDELVSL